MDWKTWNDENCNFMTQSMDVCETCEYIKNCAEWQSWFSKVPHFILDQMQKTISSPAFRVFLYLNRKADFDPKSNHHGMCWVTYDVIAENTGVSKNNMWKYIKELQDKGFIWHSTIIRKDGNNFTTSKTFTIRWIKKLADFKRFAAKVEA